MDLDNYTKIFFKVSRVENSELVREGVWALSIGEFYKIDNIPFHAYQYSADDIVKAVADENGENKLIIQKLIQASGNSTLRILTDGIIGIENIEKELDSMQCDSERCPDAPLLAVNIPKVVSYKKVKDYLDYLEVEYEEACISEFHHSHL